MNGGRHQVIVRGVPGWVNSARLLGEGDWTVSALEASADLSRRDAADVQARLRKLVLGGRDIEVFVQPKIPRPWVRSARTEDARRRRKTTAGFELAGTRLDDVGRMSLTPEVLAMAIAKQANVKTVIDAGCGAGGNSIAFARLGARVTAIDTDGERLEMARHNARVYGVVDKIHFVHDDALKVLPELKAELLFCDPPWTDLTILQDILQAGFDRTWLKLPASYDPAQIPTASPQAWFGEADGDRARVKFLLLKLQRDRSVG